MTRQKTKKDVGNDTNSVVSPGLTGKRKRGNRLDDVHRTEVDDENFCPNPHCDESNDVMVFEVGISIPLPMMKR